MPMTPEKKVKQRVVKQLKAMGLYYFYPVTGGYGSSGVPDIVICCKGRFVGIECKAGRGKVTELQQANLDSIEHNGGLALVVREENADDVTSILQQLGIT